MDEFIKTEKDGHILIITLDRPKARNAFNFAMATRMEDIVDDYELDTTLRVAVIKAEGPTFSAGQDLIAAAKGDLAGTKKRGGFGIMGLPLTKPIIAAVEGQALAGGMELTLCCDIVVASRTSVFGLSEAKRGLVAIGGGCFRLPSRIPYQIAMELILTAEPRPAEDMAKFGFVNRVVEPGQAFAEALKYAAIIARNGPLAVQASKAIAVGSVVNKWTERECWAHQHAIMEPIHKSKDLQEGLRAFAEKRDPVWTGE